MFKSKFFQSYAVNITVLSLLLAIVYFILLGHFPLLIPDEGRYNEIAREMLISGNYIIPRFNGILFFDKPPLYYWLQAFAMSWFGYQEWALRFFPAVSAIFGTIVIYLTANYFYGQRTAWFAALILTTVPLYFALAHYSNMDLEVAVWITASICCLLIALHHEHPTQKQWLIYLASIFAGFAFLTKGLIGFAFPGMVVSIWLLITRQWQALPFKPVLIGSLITLSICLPWLILAMHANANFFQYFFIVQQFHRFVHSGFNNALPFWFYIPVVWMGFAPWSFFMIVTLREHIKRYKEKFNHPTVSLFLIIWFLFIMVFFSIPESKLVGYILPVFPPLALMTAVYLTSLRNDFNLLAKSAIWIYVIVISSIAITILFWIHSPFYHLQTELIFYLQMISFVLMISAITVALFVYRNNLFSLIITWSLTVWVMGWIALTAIPHVHLQTAKPFVKTLQSILHSQDKIIAYETYLPDICVYLQRQIYFVTNWDDPQIIQKDNWRRELWLGKSMEISPALQLMNPEMLRQQWSESQRIFIFVGNENLPRLQKLLEKMPLHILLHVGHLNLVTNRLN